MEITVNTLLHCKSSYPALMQEVTSPVEAQNTQIKVCFVWVTGLHLDILNTLNTTIAVHKVKTCLKQW